MKELVSKTTSMPREVNENSKNELKNYLLELRLKNFSSLNPNGGESFGKKDESVGQDILKQCGIDLSQIPGDVIAIIQFEREKFVGIFVSNDVRSLLLNEANQFLESKPIQVGKVTFYEIAKFSTSFISANLSVCWPFISYALSAEGRLIFETKYWQNGGKALFSNLHEIYTYTALRMASVFVDFPGKLQVEKLLQAIQILFLCFNQTYKNEGENDKHDVMVHETESLFVDLMDRISKQIEIQKLKEKAQAINEKEKEMIVNKKKEKPQKEVNVEMSDISQMVGRLCKILNEKHELSKLVPQSANSDAIDKWIIQVRKAFFPPFHTIK